MTTSESESLEGPLQYEEVYNALKKMKNDKSPGTDGFTVEFYRYFWLDLGHFLIRSLNYGYENSLLSITQRLGVISIMPKGDKPRNLLSNWRPITLLNVSYKIASACFTNRINSVLSQLISYEQNDFMKGRYIGDCIRTIYDTMFNLEKVHHPGLLFAIDFEKAFDSVAFSIIEKALHLFNFGSSILRWFQETRKHLGN